MSKLTITKIYKKYNRLFTKNCSKLCSKCLQLPTQTGYTSGFSTFSIVFLTMFFELTKYTICWEVFWIIQNGVLFLSKKQIFVSKIHKQKHIQKTPKINVKNGEKTYFSKIRLTKNLYYFFRMVYNIFRWFLWKFIHREIISF